MNRSTLFGIVTFLALGMISVNLVAQDAISGTVFLVIKKRSLEVK